MRYGICIRSKPQDYGMERGGLVFPDNSTLTWFEYFDLGWPKDITWVTEGQSDRVARIRRNKYVRIPNEWRGKVVDPQTIRKRPSKKTRKQRKRQQWPPQSNKGPIRDVKAPTIKEFE